MVRPHIFMPRTAILSMPYVFLLASEFDPDRFLDERLEKYLVANPFIFLPFNAGPRICLGQQVSYTILYTAVYCVHSARSVCIHGDVILPHQVGPDFLRDHEGHQRAGP